MEVRETIEFQSLSRSLRFTLRTSDAYASLYSATDISILDCNQIHEHPYISKLGIDVLHKKSTQKALFQQLSERKFQRRELGLLLLDQKFVAGIGNYLRSEILHIANLHPDTKLADLTEEKRKELSGVIKATCFRAYKASGVTTSKEYVKRRKNGVGRVGNIDTMFPDDKTAPARLATAVFKKSLGGAETFFFVKPASLTPVPRESGLRREHSKIC